jgi:hypothetical protein
VTSQLCFRNTTPEGPVSAGDVLTISFEKPGTSGTVEITISNGEGGVQTVEVQVDDSGKGQVSWTVPSGWESVLINYPGCVEHALVVV